MAKMVSGKELGELLGVTDRSIRKYAAAGIIIRSRHGKYELVPSVRNYVQLLRHAAAGRAMSMDDLIRDALKFDFSETKVMHPPPLLKS